MSLTQQQYVVHKYVDDNWPADRFGPMIFGNHDEVTAAPGIAYASLTIVPNEGARTRNSIGAPKMIRNRGFLFFTIYAPKNRGTKLQTEAIDFLTELLDEKVLPMPNGQRLVCGISAPQTLGLKDNLYRMTLQVPYHRDEWPQN